MNGDARLRAGLDRALQQHRSGHLQDAEKGYRQILANHPRDVDALNLLALLLIESARPGEAIPLLNSALVVSPHQPQSLYNRGIAHKDLGHWQLAANDFAQCSQQQPGNAEARHALGNAMHKLGDIEAAIAQFRLVLRAKPDFTPSLQALSAALNDLAANKNLAGDGAAATSLLREAISLDPNNVSAALNLGILTEQQGDSAGAEALYRRCLALRPNLVAAHFHLAHLRDHTLLPSDVTAMQELLSIGSLAAKDRAKLAYSLSRTYSKTDHVDREFRYLTLAHDHQRQYVAYDPDRTTHLFQQLEQVFTAESGRREAPVSLEAGAGVVFVIGMPRSGTTLTEQVLASHPGAIALGDVPTLSRLAQQIAACTHRPYPDAVRHLSDNQVAQLCAEIDAHYRARRGSHAAVIETAPINFLHVGLAARFLPKARFVHCCRDPLDTCLSIYQHPLSDDHGYAHQLEHLGHYYRCYTQLTELWQRLMPARILVHRYESMVNDPETQTRKLLDFVGLDFDSRCLRFHETSRQIKTPSALQVRRPIYRDSIGRAQKYRAYLAPLIAALDK